ncbi:hypothetical protein [Metamycoplasma buccale]|uniref:hypothetical protein n=1 Tax=Metamycoplasma buccale TaxID=55602 RepID=UPI00398E5123
MNLREKMAYLMAYKNLKETTDNVIKKVSLNIDFSILKNKEKIIKVKLMWDKLNNHIMNLFRNSLYDDYQIIFENIVIKNISNTKWYLKYFSKTTFYRKFAKLIDVILWLLS